MRMSKGYVVAFVVCALSWSWLSAGGAEDRRFVVSSDEASGIYPAGRDIVFTVKPGKGGAPADLETAAVKVIFNGVEEIKPEKSMADGVLSVRLKSTQPGSYRCDVPATKSSAGVVVAPDKIVALVQEPADLDAFWTAKKELLKSKPLKCELTPLSDEQRKKIAQFESDYECFDLSVEIPVEGVRPVRGYFARPKSAKAGGCPAILNLRAAGVAGSWCIATPSEALHLARNYGAMVLDINAHGIPNDQPKAFYEALEKGDLANYSSQGKGNRDTFYFVGMYLRLLRSVDFLCAQKEWDGRHVITLGESQGGGQALAAAGLDHRISAVSAIVPALCDFSDPSGKRSGCWPRTLGWNSPGPDAKETAKVICYCDNVFLAARSKAETQIFAGLIDTTCPAHAILAAYNNLPGKKSITLYPHKAHNGLPSEDVWVGDIGTLRSTFIKQHLGL